MLLAQQTDVPDACLASCTTTSVVLLLFSAHMYAGTIVYSTTAVFDAYVLVLHSTTAAFGTYVLLVDNTNTAVFGSYVLVLHSHRDLGEIR